MGHTAMGSPNLPVLGQMGPFGFIHQYTTQNKVILVFLAKIGRSVAVFPFLSFLTISHLHLCLNCDYV